MDRILADKRVITFLHIANELCGVGKEAAFVVLIAYAGGNILHNLALTPEQLKFLRDPDDDLELTFRLYELTLSKHGNDLLSEICQCSGIEKSLIMKHAQNAPELMNNYRSNSNLFYTEHRRVDEDFRAFKPFDLRDANVFGSLVLSALSYSFCQAFDENICNFYDLYGDGKGVFFNALHNCPVTLSERSFARQTGLWPKINKSCIVSYDLKKSDCGELDAFFVCRLPISLIHRYPIMELKQFQINIGPMVAEKLLSADFFCDGDFVSFQSYKPATGVLSLACSARSALKLRKLTDGTVNSLFQLLHTKDQLRWFDEQSSALISFGPGFKIDQLNANPSLREQDTIVVSFVDTYEEFDSMIQQLTKHCLTFCENRSSMPLLFADGNARHLFITLLSPSTINDLKPFIESLLPYSSDVVTIETKPGNVFEYLAGYNANKTKELSIFDDSSYPTDCCAICFGPIDGKYIRLSLCGHVYCDDCFIGLLKNTTQFPVSCQAGCLYQLLFEDIALILARNFGSVARIQEFLTPLFHISLDSFLFAHRDKFTRCQSEGCHSLMPLAKRTMEQVSVGDPMVCFGCKMKRCTLCGEEVHQNVTCQARQEQKFNIEHPDLFAWKNEQPSNRRLCPNVHCKMLIEKGPGCNHMYCRQCGIHFCWLCINFQAGTTEEVYNHLREVHHSIGEPGFVDEMHQYFGHLIDQFGYDRAAVMINVEVAPDGQMMTDPFYAQALLVTGAYKMTDDEADDEAENEENPLAAYRDDWKAMYNRFKQDFDGYRR